MNKALTVLIDGNIFSMQRLGGISNYWINLLKFYINDSQISMLLLNLYKGYSNNYPIESFLKLYRNNPKLKISISSLPPYDNRNYRTFFHKILRNWELVKNFRLNLFDIDIYHTTYYSQPEMLCRPRKSFITCYDMIHENYLCKINGRDSAKEIIQQKKQAFNNCDSIICISKTTKKLLLLIYPNLSSKNISAIHLGYDSNFKNNLLNKDDVINKYNLNFEYFIYIGNRNLYKNFDILLQRYQEFIKFYPQVKLLIIGGEKDFTESQKKLLNWNKNIISNLVLLRDIPDEELAVLYNLSVGFISTSLEEGFGIPILEAMASDTSIILSDIEVYKEIANNNVLYFNPHSSEDLLSKMIIVYEGKKDKIKGQHGTYLDNFTWDICCEKTLESYFTSL